MSTVEVKVPDIGDFKEVEVIELMVKVEPARQIVDRILRAGVAAASSTPNSTHSTASSATVKPIRASTAALFTRTISSTESDSVRLAANVNAVTTFSRSHSAQAYGAMMPGMPSAAR